MTINKQAQRDSLRALSPAQICYARVPTALGTLLLVGEHTQAQLSLRGLYFDAAHAARAIPAGALENAPSFAEVRAQLDAYFAGELSHFEVPVSPRGTAFQRQVWLALTAIPYGTTTSYAAIARAIGRPRAVRAVGAANGRNPISIVVPCHRVIGQDGRLTGYAGGLANKRRLLELESRHERNTR